MKGVLSKVLLAILGIAMIFGAASCAGTPDTSVETTEATQKMVVGYFIQWGIYGRGYSVWDMPGEKMTHINYAFAECTPDFEIGLLDPWADIEIEFGGEPEDAPYKGNFYQLKLFKEKYTHIKSLIALGGWTKSANFSTMAQTDEGRKKFAASCVDFVRMYPFDGIDLDWEYPGGGGLAGTDYDEVNDKANFVLLCKELREQLDAAGTEDGKTYLLTAATGAGFGRIDHLDLPELAKYLDFINIMAYDFHGGWEPVSNHLAPLYPRSDDTSEGVENLCVDAVVKRYIDEGMPAAQINLGLPFYGRAWVVQGDGGKNGMLQPAVEGEVAPGTWEGGNYDYNDISKNFVTKYGSYIDEEAKTAYVFDTDNNILISYDSPETMAIKCDYALDLGLGGVMFWDVTGDLEHELMDVLVDKMGLEYEYEDGETEE